MALIELAINNYDIIIIGINPFFLSHGYYIKLI
jgi:hypothetical protein